MRSKIAWSEQHGQQHKKEKAHTLFTNDHQIITLFYDTA